MPRFTSVYFLPDSECSFGLFKKKQAIKISGLKVIILYSSGLDMMERISTKEQWLRFPPKPKGAKLFYWELFMNETVKDSSNTIELTVHTSCYCVSDLLSVNSL